MRKKEAERILKQLSDIAKMAPDSPGLYDQLTKVIYQCQSAGVQLPPPQPRLEILAALLSSIKATLEYHASQPRVGIVVNLADTRTNYYHRLIGLLLFKLEIQHVLVCQECDAFMFTSRRDRLTCSDRCRKKKARKENEETREIKGQGIL